MIYLDTSAFIKLYLLEDGSVEVHDLVVSQAEPLPVWHCLELEFLNELRFKVFLGQYFAPHLDPIALHELCLQMSLRTPGTGCRALDILHVAAARLCESTLFVTADKRQATLAEVEGRAVRLIPPP